MLTRILWHRGRCYWGLLAIVLVLRPAAGQENGKEQASSAAAVELYRSAAQLQNTGVYDLAVDEWSTLLEDHPADPLARRARHNRGICLFQLGKFREAAVDFAAVAEAPGEFDQLETTLVNLGLAYFNQAQEGAEGANALYQKALRVFDRQLQAFPRGSNAPLARFYRAEALAGLGRTSDAAQAYRTFLEQDPDQKLKARALYGLAVAHAEQDSYPQAEAALRRFLKEAPRHELTPEVQMRLGDALFAQGNHAEAGAFYASAAAANGFDLADYALLRQAANTFEQNAFAQAGRLYASLVERFPQSPHAPVARLNAGKAWLRAGEPDRAIRWFREAATRPGEASPEAAHWLSRALLQIGNASEARDVADAALDDVPAGKWRVELLLDRADAAYELEGRREEALDGYIEVAENFPDNPRAGWARYSAADVALSLGRFDVARQHAQRLLETHPQSEHAPGARFILAEIARRQGDHDAAAKALDGLLNDRPQHPDADFWRNRLALTYLASDDSRAVVRALEPVISSYADGSLQGEAEYLLGTAYLRLEEFDNAIRFLSRSIRTAANGSDGGSYVDAAHVNLARAQHGGGALGEAVETLQTLIRNAPESPYVAEAVYRLGVFEAARKDHRAALRAFERLVGEWPQSRFVPHALYAAATSHRALRNPEDAKRALDRLLKAYAEHEKAAPAHLLRASILRQLGDPAAALRDLAQYLSSDSPERQHGDALYLQGLCFAALNQHDSAVASYTELLEEHPAYPQADRVWYELGWTYKDADRDPEARRAFSQLAEHFPASELAAEALFHVGESYYASKDFASAAEAYAAAVSADPSEDIREKALHKEAWSYFQAEEYEKAAERFAAQLEALPEAELALDARVMLGECHFQREDYPRALAELEKVLPAVGASRSLQIIGLLHGGQAAAKEQKWDRALQLLEQCQERFPDAPYRHEVRYELGWVRYNLGRHDQAYEDFAAVAEEHPGELGVRAQYMQGEIAMDKKQYADAVRIFYRTAFGHGYPEAPPEYHPWQAAAMFDAARCLEQLGKQDAARKLYKDLLDQFPEEDQAQHARVRLEELGS